MDAPFAGTFALIAAPFAGSFIGTLVDRLPAGRPLVFARSSCPHCAHGLSAHELIPLVSWLVQQGVCRHCGRPLGAFYPSVELAALAVALTALFAMGGAPIGVFLASLALGWTLLGLAWIDARHFYLPDILVVPLIPAGIAFAWLTAPEVWMGHALGAALGYGSLIAIARIYRALRKRDGLGGGDAKLMAAAGAWVSWSGLASVLLIASVSALLAVVFIRRRGTALTGSSALPFGPWLALGIWTVWLFGPLSLA